MKNIFLLFLLCISSLFSHELQKVTLQLQWKHQFEFAGFYAAKEMGYYKDAGIEVEFKEYTRDKNIIDSVLDDEAQFGLVYSSLIAEYLKGKELVFIANYFKQSPLILVAQPEIRTPKELKGKKLMGVSDDIDSITLKLMLEKFGLFQNDIVNIPTTFNIQDFIDRKVDAMAVFTTNEIYQLDKLGIKYTIFNPSLYGHEYYDVNLFSSKKFASKNKDLVYKFKEASNKGWEYALKNKQQITDLILKKYNSQNKTKEAILFEAKQIEQIMFTKSEDIGSIDPLRVQLIAKNFIEAGFADQKYLYKLDELIFSYTKENSLEELTSDEKKYLQKNIITIGMVNDYYPFSYIENNDINGFSYEYFKLLASKVDMRYKIELNSWSNTLQKFKEKKLDIIDAISYTKKREFFTKFTEPYFNIPNVILARKDTIKNYRGLESLKGKRVGITKDIYYFDTVKNLNLFDLVIYKSSRDKIKDLALGKLDAAFNNLTSAQKYIIQGGYSNIESLDEINDALIKKEDLRLGVLQENTLLYSILKKARKLVTPSEKLKLVNKYFGPTKINKDYFQVSKNTISQSIKKIAESISEYVWIYRLDLLIESLKRWLDFFQYEAAYFHDQELHEYVLVWRDNGIIKHTTSNEKPNLDFLQNYQKINTTITKNNHSLGELTIFYSNSHLKYKNSIQLTKEEREFLNEHPNIKIHLESNYAPYSFLEDDEFRGFTYEYANLISDLLGVKFIYEKNKNWNDAIEDLKNKKIDAIAQMTETKKRKKYALFTTPFSSFYNGIVTTKSNSIYKKIEDLYGKKVGIVRGYVTAEIVSNLHKPIKIELYKNNAELIQKVIEGEIDAAISTYHPLNYLINKNKLTSKLSIQRMSIDPSMGEAFEAFGIREDWPLFKSALNKMINITQAERFGLEQKWFSSKKSKKQTIELTQEQKKYLENKKEILMCVDPNWLPYEKIDKYDNHVGIAANFIDIIEKKINKKITLVPTHTWSESLQYLKNGKCEILSFLNQTQQRDKFLNFTSSLYDETEVIVAKDEVTYIDGFKALEGKSIGLIKGYRTEEYLKKNFPRIKIHYIKNYEEGIKLVSAGKIYAIINSLLGTAHLLKQNNFLDIKIAGKTSLVNNYRIGITKRDPVLTSILSKAVESITQKEKDTIISNYVTVKFQNKIDYTLLFQILFGAFILFLLFSYWTYKLKNENKKRKEAEKELTKLNLELEDRIKKAIEEIQKKEKMLQHQTRLAQMGEMISMIAHQWRQPIGAINSAIIAINFKVETSKSLFENSKETQELLTYIEKKSSNVSTYIQFLSSTIDDFRNFFKPDKQKELTSLGDILEDTLRIIESSLISKNIQLIKSYNNDEKITLYKNEMIQVLLNILQNAQDHILEKQIQNPSIQIHTKKSKDIHSIEIYDNAGGIPEEIIEKIFDPYFSTKNEKNGTGIGLYMSKIIIEEHNKGKITVSNKNNGACFLIELAGDEHE